MRTKAPQAETGKEDISKNRKADVSKFNARYLEEAHLGLAMVDPEYLLFRLFTSVELPTNSSSEISGSSSVMKTNIFCFTGLYMFLLQQ